MSPLRLCVMSCVLLAAVCCAASQDAVEERQPSMALPIVVEDLQSVITAKIDPAFYEAAVRAGTDKSTSHSYHYLYSKYLAAVRLEELRLLEIGLGCDMQYGPGHSLELWRRYLPHSRISFLEYDAECSEKHRSSIEGTSKGRLFVGDQADETLLQDIVSDARTFQGYDVIIDDGGHRSHQMLTSFKVLWQALRPGGVYVVEDVSVNFDESPFRDPGTFIAHVKLLIDETQCRMVPVYMEPDSAIRQEFKEFCAQTSMDVVSVECMPEACAIVKGISRQRLLPGMPSLHSNRSQHSHHTHFSR